MNFSFDERMMFSFPDLESQDKIYVHIYIYIYKCFPGEKKKKKEKRGKQTNLKECITALNKS